MFALFTGEGVRSTRRSPWPMVVSTLAHVAVVTLAIVLPLLYITHSLPTPPTMMAFVATAPPPPPPPPPVKRAAVRVGGRSSGPRW